MSDRISSAVRQSDPYPHVRNVYTYEALVGARNDVPLKQRDRMKQCALVFEFYARHANHLRKRSEASGSWGSGSYKRTNPIVGFPMWTQLSGAFGTRYAGILLSLWFMVHNIL
jgi:hypothetical protein